MITVSPSNVDFGALAPGESATEIVKTSEAPADAQVIATIVGDDAAFFNIHGLSSYEWVLEPVDPGELPPGFKGHPKQRVLELASQADGKTPLSVSEGQLVHVEIEAIAPTQSDKFNLRARLFIQGDTWGDPLAVDLTLLSGHVDIAPDSLEVSVSDTTPGRVKFTSELVSGPSTFVVFEPANWDSDAVVTIGSDKPGNSFSIGPGDAPATAPLLISLSGPFRSGFFHLAATAFEKKQQELFVFQIV